MPCPRHPRANHDGAILIESLVALALLSLCAAGTLTALEQVESTSQSLRQLSGEVRAQSAQAEAVNPR